MLTHSLSMLAGEQDEQQLVVEPDGLVDLLVQFAASLHVVRREPAADAIVLQIGMELFGKVDIVAGIADEAGVELSPASAWRGQQFDEAIWKADSSQELKWQGMRAGQSAEIDDARSFELACLQA